MPAKSIPVRMSISPDGLNSIHAYEQAQSIPPADQSAFETALMEASEAWAKTFVAKSSPGGYPPQTATLDIKYLHLNGPVSERCLLRASINVLVQPHIASATLTGVTPLHRS